MNYEMYLNSDGSYTSPKNGKIYKSKKALIAHLYCKSIGGWGNANNIKQKCLFCDKETNKSNIVKHETYCYLNPKNLSYCKVCNKPIKNYKHSKGTCSYSCSNSYFKRIKNPDERLHYRTLCFRYHKKECVVCGENKIVEVHHYDGNHENNVKENLIPICPTHHQYFHSRYKNEVEYIIDEYINNWKLNN
jgi:hypothetical protein